MMEEQQAGIRPWQWILTVIVIIAIALVVYFMVRGGDNDSMNPPSNQVNTETPSVPAGPRYSSLSVNDQFPGNVVFLTSVTVTKPGFAVVYESTAGKAGAVIGTLYFPNSGTYPGKVLLSKPTIDGRTYIVELHEDDSDQLFDGVKDAVFKDALGGPVMKTFKAMSQITEVKG